jgi:uncharacterized protein YkuJ
MKKTKWLDRALILGPRYCLCTSKQQFSALMKEMNFENERRVFLNEGCEVCVHHFESDNESTVCVVCLNMTAMLQYDGIEIAAILVHESAHIWQRYLKYIGEEHPSKEFEAYSIEAISEGLMRAYAEQAE